MSVSSLMGIYMVYEWAFWYCTYVFIWHFVWPSSVCNCDSQNIFFVVFLFYD